MDAKQTYSGFVGLIGRPNVGKSTLLNAILREKVSITSRKPQTTRQQILGIKTEDNYQYIFIDTPGIHAKASKALNRFMNKSARSVVNSVDLVLHLVDVNYWGDEDEAIYNLVSKLKCPKYLIVNKIDLVDNDVLLSTISEYASRKEYQEIIPVSAQKNNNVEKLMTLVRNHLPESPFLFPKDQVTDKSKMFQIAESIREKLMDNLHKEIPYSLTVQIEKYQEDDKIDKVSAIIWVERKSQKGIVIGKKGEILKRVGKSVRREFETKLKKKVFLELWVKVKEGWADKEDLLKTLGYTDNE